jgi:hypothetical protein
MLYDPAKTEAGCTSADEARRRWADILARAKDLEIDLPASPRALSPVVFGAAIPAKECILARGAAPGTRCRQVYKHRFTAGLIEMTVALIAIPEAPDRSVCQFAGHRFGAAIQVTGFDFGKMEAEAAPGGFANRYDCRSLQFSPLRLSLSGATAVLLGSFRAANIADRDEYPFLVVVPVRPAP